MITGREKKAAKQYAWTRSGSSRHYSDPKTFSLKIHTVKIVDGKVKRKGQCVVRVVGDVSEPEKAALVADALVSVLNRGEKTLEYYPKVIDAQKVDPKEISHFPKKEYVVNKAGIKQKCNRGFAHGRAKLTMEKIVYIFDHYQPGLKGGGRVRHPNSSVAIGEKIGIDPCHVRRIYNGKNWKHLRIPRKFE